ncbi:hypothetical protein Tco_1579376 [Tanacetum coccineum]
MANTLVTDFPTCWSCAKVTREQTSDDNDSQEKSDENKNKRLKTKATLVTIVGKNVTLSVNVLSPRRTRRMLAELGVKSEDGDKPQKDATCLMEIDSQEIHPKPSIYNNDIDIIKLENENEELLRFNKDFAKTFKKPLKEKR